LSSCGISPTGATPTAIRERPEEYERRVVGFFNEALLEAGES
jgi:hypothetical protein